MAECWPRLLAGESGIASITLFDASQYRAKVAAEIATWAGAGLADTDNFASPPEPGTRRGTRVFLESVRQAYDASGLEESGFDRRQAGIAAGA